MIPFTNRDNKTISIGLYSILDFEKEKAERLLSNKSPEQQKPINMAA